MDEISNTYKECNYNYMETIKLKNICNYLYTKNNTFRLQLVVGVHKAKTTNFQFWVETWSRGVGGELLNEAHVNNMNIVENVNWHRVGSVVGGASNQWYNSQHKSGSCAWVPSLACWWPVLGDESKSTWQSCCNLHYVLWSVLQSQYLLFVIIADYDITIAM